MDVKAAMGNAMDASAMGRAEGLELRGKTERDIGKVKKLATDFEAMFMEQMLKGMRSSVQKSGLIDGGNAEEIYTSMLDSEYAKNMANQHNGGLSDMIERQLLQSMGVKSDASTVALGKRAIHAYEKSARPTLQDAQKTVTIGTGSVPQPKATR